MRGGMQRAAGAAVIAVAAGHAPATITVTVSPPSGPTFSLIPVGGKTRVLLSTNVTTQPTTFLVRGAATDQIENVVLTANVNQTVFVEIRGQTAGTAIASLDSIDQGASPATCVLQDLRTSGDVGTIRLNTISNMNVGGDITGGITHPPRGWGGEASLIAGTVAGRIRGDILVDHGAIYSLTATNGIGAPAAPVQVRTQGNIVRLIAREIHADINSLSNGGSGMIGWIETTAGPFVGSLTTLKIERPTTNDPGALIVSGDLDADVTTLFSVNNSNGGQPVVNIFGRFMEGRTFRIGLSLFSGVVFRVATPGGLQGQVIINGNGGTGVWTGSVTVGGTTLGPVPTYSSLSAPLGGGSVGLVPFRTHGADSWPATGTALTSGSAPSPSNPIRLRYYGPIMWPAGSMPVIVEAGPLASPGTWINQTACFTAAREPGASPHPNVLALYPTRPLPGGYAWRVRPVVVGPAALLCDLGLSPNPPVADEASAYLFTITGGCAGDADGNGVVNFSDISTTLTAWGSTTATCVSPTDVNADGIVNFADITAILSNWGASCN